MIPEPSAGLWVTVAAGVVVGVTAPILFVLTDVVFRTKGLEAGRIVALATMMVSAAPLILRAVHRARGGPPDSGARWVLDVAILGVGALLFLFMRASSPRVMYEGCGFNGEQCTKGGNSSPALPDGPADDPPPSPPTTTPPLTR